MKDRKYSNISHTIAFLNYKVPWKLNIQIISKNETHKEEHNWYIYNITYSK